jgi:hypothetical protein
MRHLYWGSWGIGKNLQVLQVSSSELPITVLAEMGTILPPGEHSLRQVFKTKDGQCAVSAEFTIKK